MKIQALQTAALSKTTIMENIRNKAFFILAGTGTLCYLFTLVLGMMAVGDLNRVILDGGLWILGIFGLISALFLSINTIQGEIRTKTIYLLLSRPVSRNTYILGKFSGILAVMLILHLFLSLVFILVLYGTENAITGKLFVVLGSLFIEWVVLAAFSLLFAVFTSPFLHGIFLTGIYFIGHWTKYLYAFSQNTSEPLLQKLLAIFYLVFPNLEALNYKSHLIYDLGIEPHQILLSLLSGAGWTCVAILASTIIFNQKKLV